MTSSLKLIARWINNVACSDSNDTKKNLLNLLINVIKDFDTTEIETTSNDLPSFFQLNTVFAIKKINISKDKEISQLNSETFKNYGEILASSVWQSHTIIKENKSSLEEPESLVKFHEAIPKNLTSFFDSLIANLCEKKHEIVSKKRKQLVFLKLR